MLDKRTNTLLEYLVQICKDGSYKVIEISDLIKHVSPKNKIDESYLAQMIKFLSNNELIDVKYKDDKVYCISVLPRGRAYTENCSNTKNSIINTRKNNRRIGFVAFFAAFAGAFIATLLAGLL